MTTDDSEKSLERIADALWDRDSSILYVVEKRLVEVCDELHDIAVSLRMIAGRDINE